MGKNLAKKNDLRIEKYTSYFHDGSLLGIKQTGNDIEISLSSAEVDPENLSAKSIVLAERDNRNFIEAENIYWENLPNLNERTSS